ncbi:hypothetical protein FIBSPDRAFT_847402 [Athelia psychrophila]|uniref:Wax synthase domain-containing protein n=1 Tax=Athelia psychrophila TaxID=1759441 RepID=A0A166W819_9AGAM|nr:hypothetical protein FIBSPDRAFT_847402 [Fibularhizoctonia sp. CBS 109695]
MIAKALDFGLAKHGRRKLEESTSKENNQAIVSNGSGKATGGDAETETIERPAFLRLGEAAELCGSMRGMGWDFGAGVYIPQDNRSLERAPFLRATFFSLIQNILILDILDSSLKLLPGVGDPSGGSIFYPQLPPLQRYAVSTAIHVISGYSLIEGFATCYDSLALWGVMALHNAPSSWPPVMDDPWASTSLHEFWAKRWHQLLRRTFIILGGYPGRLIGGNTGMIYGTFVASGMFHELAIYAMGQGLDYRVVLFFSVQGPLLTVETLWRKATGGMVGGWAGRVWVFFVLVVLGQGMTDSWHTRGLAGGMVIPPALSPMRQLVFPALALIAKRWKA